MSEAKPTFRPPPYEQIDVGRPDGASAPKSRNLPGSGNTVPRLDFLVVSPAKTASTWLYSLLGTHPDIRLCRTKEPHYFTRYFRSWTVDDYFGLFPDGPGLRGDVSTSYTMMPRDQIANIQIYWPDIRIVAILRNPLERLWSHTRFDAPISPDETQSRQLDALRSHCLSHRGLETTITDNAPVALEYWRNSIAPENFFVATMEHMHSPDRRGIHELCAFLGIAVDRLDPDELDRTVNAGPNPVNLSTVAAHFCAHVVWDSGRKARTLVDAGGRCKAPANWEQDIEEAAASVDAAHLVQQGLRGRNVFLYRGWYFAVPEGLIPSHFDMKGHLVRGNDDALKEAATCGRAVSSPAGHGPIFRSRFHSVACARTSIHDTSRGVRDGELDANWATDEFTGDLDGHMHRIHLAHGNDALVLLGSAAGSRHTYNLVFYRRHFYAVPQARGDIDWNGNVASDPDVIVASELAYLKAMISAQHAN